jgi:hypothetical protein
MFAALDGFLLLRLISGANRRCDLDKRGQHFNRTHNVTLSVVAVCVDNPDCSPVGIQGLRPAQAPSGFLRLSATISQYFTAGRFFTDYLERFAVRAC